MVQVGQDPPCSANHRRQGIFGQMYGKAGRFRNSSIQVLKQPAAAGKDDTAIDQIHSQLRRCLFQRFQHGFGDRSYRFIDRLH